MCNVQFSEVYNSNVSMTYQITIFRVLTWFVVWQDIINILGDDDDDDDNDSFLCRWL